MGNPGYVDAAALNVDTLNALIDKGERFYVTYDSSPIFDDSLWECDHAFWGDGEPGCEGLGKESSGCLQG